ncbi:FAD-dependent monooxygenase [Tepidimonas charontis]|uniref:3-hydroxybenzoate 6-hydroxylase n=1 Tax=Tepidimonas charontis TaxID=2267262 RepID=A0A554XFL1_9BURK|nr:FAD-dependent monooxygenase [Tepidimonas charontis]TSE34620.1 3-hydroxybenzoate 6-hydroxylase [Tepidimonas charontis]
MSTPHALIVGGGIGGLGAALACTRAQPALHVTLLERAPAFSEVGAGIQLGPNAVRVLHDWGLRPALQDCAAWPRQLRVRDAGDGAVLGTLALAGRAEARYGQPYATIHRADLHGLLLHALRGRATVTLHTATEVLAHQEEADGVTVQAQQGPQWRGDVLLAADGVWSRTRQRLLGDGAVVYCGHLAYRGLVPMADVPAPLRLPEVVVWLGPRMHAVHYPVRAGAWLNVVIFVEGPLPGDAAPSWDHAAHAVALRQALGAVPADLAALVEAVPAWRLWPLFVREPMAGPREQAVGRVALLGDAAHPTRPYLAQGAAMALEDAWALGRLLQAAGTPRPDWPALLQRWAAQRWARNARVQARSRRNGVVFHASGVLRWARNRALAVGGPYLLDQPWLYAGPPDPLAH